MKNGVWIASAVGALAAVVGVAGVGINAQLNSLNHPPAFEVAAPEEIFRPLDAVSRVDQVGCSLDGHRYACDEYGTPVPVQAAPVEYDLCYHITAEGHAVTFEATLVEYGLWADNPWLHWAMVAVALMVLPMMAATTKSAIATINMCSL